VINQASEAEDVGQDDLDIRDLYSGVQSLIQGGDQNLIAEEVQLTKPGLAQEAAEEKQLYEVLPEVNMQAADGQIFGSKHGYQIPGAAAATAA